MRNEKDQICFVIQAKILAGILNVQVPTTPDMFEEYSDVPPDDPEYSKQWYLRANKTYGTQAEKAWEIKRDNNA